MNDSIPKHMRDLVEDTLCEKGMNPQDARVCILGFASLDNSDGTRNTLALPLYNLLKSVCKEVTVHDPYVKEYEGITLTRNLEEALRNKDCAVIATRHKEYVNIPLDWLKNVLATPVIVDGRNIFDPKDCEEAGFSYRGIGIGKKEKAVVDRNKTDFRATRNTS